jgi:hypothetical protein
MEGQRMCHNNTGAEKWQDDPGNSYFLTGLTGYRQAGTIRADQLVFSFFRGENHFSI